MENQKTQLKVGDRITTTLYGEIVSIKAITRVTKTLAFTDTGRYKVNINSDGYVNVPGRGYSSGSLHRLTKEGDRALLKKAIHIQRIKKYDLRALTADQVEEIYRIIMLAK